MMMDDITDSFCSVEPVYDLKKSIQDIDNNKTFLFDFYVVYTKVPEPGSDGEADYMSGTVEIRTTHQLREYGQDLFIGQDEEQIKSTIYAILYEIGVPAYQGIVKTFTEEILNIMKSPLEILKKIKVTIEVTATTFLEDEIDVEETDVKYLVSGASVEEIERNLEIITSIDESVGDCVICMETIQVGSVSVGRTPCRHMFHRACIQKWLEQTGICPLCRDVFPV